MEESLETICNSSKAWATLQATLEPTSSPSPLLFLTRLLSVPSLLMMPAPFNKEVLLLPSLHIGCTWKDGEVPEQHHTPKYYRWNNSPIFNTVVLKERKKTINGHSKSYLLKVCIEAHSKFLCNCNIFSCLNKNTVSGSFVWLIGSAVSGPARSHKSKYWTK